MLLNKIEQFLIKRGFIKNVDFSNKNNFTYELRFSKQDFFRVSVFFNEESISVDVDLICLSDKQIIARRYEIDNMNEFLFLIKKTSRSPLFQES